MQIQLLETWNIQTKKQQQKDTKLISIKKGVSQEDIISL